MSATHLLPPTTVELPRRKRFTRPEVQRLAEGGHLDGQRFELVEGDLIDKMGQNPPHAYVIGLVVDWLTGIFGSRRLRVQVPVEVAAPDRERSSPEPDIAVLVDAKPEYQIRHPRGDELRLVVEVADTSVQFDLTVKARLYARADVPEYWVLDIAGRWLFIHRHPVDGEYRQVTRLGEQESISLADRLAPFSVTVSQLLPQIPN